MNDVEKALLVHAAGLLEDEAQCVLNSHGVDGRIDAHHPAAAQYQDLTETAGALRALSTQKSVLSAQRSEIARSAHRAAGPTS